MSVHPAKLMICMAVLVGAAAIGEADAAKEKFVRSKPHVNVGTMAGVGFGELTEVFVRLDEPPTVADEHPLCDFEGQLVIQSLNDGGPVSTGATVEKLELVVEEIHPISLTEPNEMIVVGLPQAATADSRREFYVSVVSDVGPGDKGGQCGVEMFVVTSNLTTGETVARSQPFYSNYRPQFYFRTVDVTGGQ